MPLIEPIDHIPYCQFSYWWNQNFRKGFVPLRKWNMENSMLKYHHALESLMSQDVIKTLTTTNVVYFTVVWYHHYIIPDFMLFLSLV